MAKKTIDAVAGDGSTAGILRRHREALESGDIENMHPTVGEGYESVTEEPAKPRPSKNRSSQVLKRGYFKA